MRTSEPLFSAGSVVVVPFPYSDRHAEKRRPAVVVSHSRLIEQGLVWVVMVTTAKAGKRPHDVPIDQLADAGLREACVVRPTKIACIEPARIVRQSGQLSHEATRRVVDTVASLLAFSTKQDNPDE